MKRAGFNLDAPGMVAWDSASHGGAATPGELKRQLVTHSQGMTTAANQFDDHTSTRITTSPEKIAKIAKNIPSQSSGRNCLSFFVSKSRPKLTESEKQERKARRIMSNREAARETIRRRQAVFMELSRKAADVSEENENLKKEKELAVEVYNSLKCRNKLLKAKLAKSKKLGAEDYMQVNPKGSRAENSSSRPNHTSMVPCFWPPVFPPPDSFKFQCANPHSPETSPSHFPMFLYPMPWLPFIAQGHTPHSQSSTCPLSFEDDGHLSEADTSSSKISMTTGLTSPSESDGVDSVEYPTRYPDGTFYVPGLFSRVKPQESSVPTRNDVCVQQLYKETDDTYAATEARKRRKELMKMKNVPKRDHANTNRLF